MRRLLIILLAASWLPACKNLSDGHQPTGPVVFVDAAGNRMTVVPEQEIAREVAAPEAAPEPAPTPAPPEVPGAQPKEFSGEQYIDSDDLDREMSQRDSKRFYVVPNAVGGRQVLEAGKIGATGQVPPPRVAEYPAPVWQICRVILPLLPLKAASHHELSFPATDGKQIYAGFLMEVPEDPDHLTIWSYIRKGRHAVPVLARLDNEGRVVALVNNMPTLSIPESGFRYARIGGLLDMRGKRPESGRFAILDGARLYDRLPAACGMAAPGVDASEGLVTLQFTLTGEK